MDYYHQTERDRAATIGSFLIFGAIAALVIVIIATL